MPHESEFTLTEHSCDDCFNECEYVIGICVLTGDVRQAFMCTHTHTHTHCVWVYIITSAKI